MTGKDEIREFLRSRRAKITPDQAGLRTYGGRRVPGLRREEVAMLAGVSNDYCARLERGNLGGVSESVLESLSRALQLDEAERAHLLDLARAAGPVSTKPRRRPTPEQVRPSVLQILDSMTTTPAYVRNGRRDILAANPLGRALYAVMYDDGATRPPNVARFVFLDERAPSFFPEWERVADDAVAALRIEAGKDPHDRALSDLVGELTTRSEAFAVRWARHDVHLHRSGRKRLLHPVVGELELTFEVLELSADTGQTINAYAAEPGSRSAEGLALLASWAATPTVAADPAPDARASPPD